MKRKLTVGSLFAGIGGLELGLEQAGGFKTVWSVEIDKFCNEIRRRHWPGVPQFGDIREFLSTGYAERPDLICGGSPCQDLSCAGKRAGLAGKHSGLFQEMARVVCELQSRYVVWENVWGALSSNGGADFRAVLRSFSDLGYDAEWTLLRASDFGYPHQRARVFVVAYRQGDNGRGRVSEEKAGTQADGERRGRLAGGDSELADSPRALRQRPASGEQGQPALEGEGLADTGADKLRQAANINRASSADISYSPPGPNETERWAEILAAAPWLAPAVEPGLCGVVDGLPVAVDDARVKRLRALGNAVVPACARWIGERILEWERKNKAGKK